MNKDDKKNIVVFSLLIIGILIVLGINIYRNRKHDVDRKIEYIYGYNINAVVNKGEALFKSAMNLLLKDDIFEYHRNLDNSIAHFAINGKSNYLRINNFSLVNNTFSKNNIQSFIDYKNIISYKNDYYIQDTKIKNNNYVGSIIEFDSYDYENVLFSSTNYYCDNSSYEGILIQVPKCDYETKKTTFKVALENDLFRISDIYDIFDVIS